MTGRFADGWFSLPRETRAVLVANEQIKSLEASILAFEDEQKRNLKRK